MSRNAIKLFILFTLVSLVIASGNCDDLALIDAIKPEPPCSAAGGMCVIAADCPHGNLSKQRGLCPKQRTKGIECCYGISVKETRCRKYGGECMSDGTCNPDLIVSRATDCAKGSTCCVLV